MDECVLCGQPLDCCLCDDSDSVYEEYDGPFHRYNDGYDEFDECLD